VQTSELIMLGRRFDADESAQLQQLKQNLNTNSVNTASSKLHINVTKKLLFLLINNF